MALWGLFQTLTLQEVPIFFKIPICSICGWCWPFFNTCDDETSLSSLFPEISRENKFYRRTWLKTCSSPILYSEVLGHLCYWSSLSLLPGGIFSFGARRRFKQFGTACFCPNRIINVVKLAGGIAWSLPAMLPWIMHLGLLGPPPHLTQNWDHVRRKLGSSTNNHGFVQKCFQCTMPRAFLLSTSLERIKRFILPIQSLQNDVSCISSGDSSH